MIKTEVVREALKYLPSKVIPGAVGLLTVPVLTHSLSQEQYGQYVHFSVTLSLIYAACSAWVCSTLLRYNAARNSRPIYLFTARLITASLAVASAAWVVYCRGRLPDSTMIWATLAGILWLWSHGAYEFHQAWLRSVNHAAIYSIAISWKSAAGLLCAFLAVSLADSNLQSLGALAGFALPMLACGLFVAVFARTQTPLVSSDPLPANEKSALLRYGVPIIFSSACLSALSVSDRYVVEHYLGLNAVAVYGASYEIAEKTIFFVNALLQLSSSVSIFKRFDESGAEKGRAYVGDLMRFYIFFTFPIAAVLAIYAPAFVPIIFPPEYVGGASVASVVAVSGLLVGIAHRYSIILSVHMKSGLLLLASGGALVANVVLCLLLVPRFGIVGAAMSTFIGHGVLATLTAMFSRPYGPPPFPWRAFAWTVTVLLAIAGCLMSTGLLAWSSHSFVRLVPMMGATILVMYGLLYWGGRVVTIFRRAPHT